MGAAAATAKAPAAGGGVVSGTVTLSAALAKQAQPDDTVFVFARAAEGSRMPLAILRKQVKDLPFNFKLDDSMAMSPTTALSSATKVIVGARVSKSGNAMPQPGDLSGQSQPVNVGTTGIKVEIHDAVKP
jgi:cytochrome c-type biogenesis protein CcmH